MRVETTRECLCFCNAEIGVRGKMIGTSKMKGEGDVDVVQETS